MKIYLSFYLIWFDFKSFRIYKSLHESISAKKEFSFCRKSWLISIGQGWALNIIYCKTTDIFYQKVFMTFEINLKNQDWKKYNLLLLVPFRIKLCWLSKSDFLLELSLLIIKLQKCWFCTEKILNLLSYFQNRFYLLQFCYEMSTRIRMKSLNLLGIHFTLGQRWVLNENGWTNYL